MKCRATLLCVLIIGAQALYADDWPMWRYDSYRSACSEEQLPETLTLQWGRQYSPREQVWDDPMNNDMMTYDKVFEPIIMGNKLFVNFNDSDKLVALDLSSGKEVWRFYTDGPVRLAPAACKGKVYISSDDGHLYCVSAETGKQIWKFRGGPSSQKVIGNKRVISMWPARGGPVIRDGHVYFAAGIWPFVGTFIYALDAETGKVAWVNDHTGSRYALQPHSGPGFGSVAPQGALVATKEVLIVPGGRSIPAAFNRQTGSFMHFRYADYTKGRGGGSFVAADERRVLFHMEKRGVTSFDLMTGTKGKKLSGLNEPVLSGDMIYTSDNSSVRALNSDLKDLWKVQADGSGDLIKTGNRLYAAGVNDISVIELSGEKQGTVVQKIPVKGKVLRLLAGNGKLAAVTLEGSILVFGNNAKTGSVIEDKKTSLPRNDCQQMVADILKHSAAYEGYGLCFGVDDGKLLDELLNQSKLHVVAVDPDKQKVEQLRQRYDKAGLYGKRISVHQGTPADFKAPSFTTNVIVVGKDLAKTYSRKDILDEIYRSVRPYGGALWYPVPIASSMPVKKIAGGAMIFRSGALEGAADWTHQYADIANTVKSNDKRVKLPLGILWFGGNSHVDVLPRHAHGPTELVAGGRLFIEGMDSISARDVYTGRVMWKRQFKEMDTYGVYYTYPYNGDPLSTAYSPQHHYSGSKIRGSNYAVTDDSVYLAMGNSCQALDAATGKTKHTFTIPDENGQKRNWGFVGVYKDILLAGAGFANYTEDSVEDQAKNNAENGPQKGGGATALDNLSASKGIIAFNRHTGERLWDVKANYSFYHNAIVAGNDRLYCLDRLPEFAEAHLLRRGKDVKDKYRIATFDINSGKRLWQNTEHALGSWLAFSEKHDILFMEGKGMRTFNGKTGDVLWEKSKGGYKPPIILHNDILITTAPSNPNSADVGGAFSLLDGTDVKITNPLTGGKEPWQIGKRGCGYIIGAENLLTFRYGSAGYYDLKNITGTGNFGGFKSGCSASLVVANGVLNAPDYTRTCRCIYQNQTSMAMIHMPEVETWTGSQFANEWSAHGAIKRMGINFGAPGDRLAENGTLWLDWPAVGGLSPSPEIKIAGTPVNTYTRHISVPGTRPHAWIIASGIKNTGAITINLITREGADDPSLMGKGQLRQAEKAKKDSAVKGSEKASEKDKAEIVQNTEGSYTVRLYFAEPDNKQPGERVFDVSIQGQTVLKDLDIVKEAGGQWKSLVKEFKNVQLKDALYLTMTPKGTSETLLSGIEIIRE